MALIGIVWFWERLEAMQEGRQQTDGVTQIADLPVAEGSQKVRSST